MPAELRPRFEVRLAQLLLEEGMAPRALPRHGARMVRFQPVEAGREVRAGQFPPQEVLPEAVSGRAALRGYLSGGAVPVERGKRRAAAGVGEVLEAAGRLERR